MRKNTEKEFIATIFFWPPCVQHMSELEAVYNNRSFWEQQVTDSALGGESFLYFHPLSYSCSALTCCTEGPEMTVTCSFSMSFNYLCTIRADGNLYMRGNEIRLIKMLMYFKNNIHRFWQDGLSATWKFSGSHHCSVLPPPLSNAETVYLKEQTVLAMLVSNKCGVLTAWRDKPTFFCYKKSTFWLQNVYAEDLLTNTNCKAAIFAYFGWNLLIREIT